MKRLFMCALLTTCLQLGAQPTIEEIKKSNPSKVQIIFEVEREPDVDQELWQELIDTIFKNYQPSISTNEELEEWIMQFSKMLKRVAQVSALTKKTHGSLTFRVLTD